MAAEGSEPWSWPGTGLGPQRVPVTDSSRPFLLAPLCPVSPQRHHFAQAIAILNTHGCNIFDHFSRKVMGLCGGLLGGSWALAGQKEQICLGVDGMCAAGTVMPLP